MAPMSSREVRDAVHGLIDLTDHEWKVVDSPAFQRLRGVQQLPLTHLVYPGARHSRFEHCVGTCHLAGRMADRLGLEPRERQRVRAAALVHDVGHGPFSQVGEFIFEELTGQTHVHEKISAAIVRFHAPIRSVLDADVEWIAELLTGTGHGATPSVARDIISGSADIDKMDYLLRDSYFCGVDYGRFDIDKLIEAARLVRNPDGDYLAYDRDGLFAVESLLLARYHMHRQIYGHKTRLGIDKMLIRAIVFGVHEGLLPRRVFAPENLDADFVEEYIGWDDYRTLATLAAAPDSRAGEIVRALLKRRLMKLVVNLEVDDLVGAQAGRRPAENLKKEQAAAEKLIAEAAGVDPMWVAVHGDEPQNSVKEVSIIDGRTGTVGRFTELSDLFKSGGPRSQPSVSVYVLPPDGTDALSADARTAIRRAALEALHQVGEAEQAS
jgi:HD superfamily phosphohydrolase